MHRRFLATLLLVLVAVSAGQSTQDLDRDVMNVAAFARLYGVVRYFYPSDTAAAIDWNRFAVYGVKRSRVATDPASLETELRRLFAPMGLGIEIGLTLPPIAVSQGYRPDLVAWRYLGAGLSRQSGGPYGSERTNRPAFLNTSFNGVAMLAQNVSAEHLRGKTTRLSGQVRSDVQNGSGNAALWLRVDRLNQATGFSDYMSDRPVQDSTWREYSVEGSVASDATNIAFGMMAVGRVAADFDKLELAASDGHGAWARIPIKDADFEAAETSTSWLRTGSASNVVVTRHAPAPEGRQYLRLAPASQLSKAELQDMPPRAGAYADLDLGRGLKGRVPIALTDQEAREEATGREQLRSSLAAIAGPDAQADVDVRLADTVVAWNGFRHFYPYWSDVGVDWNARLGPLLEMAWKARGRDQEAEVLRLLVAEVHDGHGRVIDNLDSGRPSFLPIRLALIEGRPVVSASGVPEEAPIGSMVTMIDGVPASERIAAEMRLMSGSRQWREVRAADAIVTGPSGSVVTMVLENRSRSRLIHLRRESAAPLLDVRPAALVELAPRTWYLDLTRVQWSEVAPRLATLADAAAVVFDVRGYPNDAGARVLPYLLDRPEDDRWMHIPKIVEPFGQMTKWMDLGWALKPTTPHFSGKRAFLTDGRAISYAESVMGYVADHKLGTIIGSPTAGTNGNVATFVLPGGFAISFTGMRVTAHDGRTSRHLRGIQPDILVTPTIAGMLSGRDEVLEHALTLVQAPRP